MNNGIVSDGQNRPRIYRMDRIQKVIILLYILTVAIICLSAPRVKYFSDGCKFMTETWIWNEPILLLDIGPDSGDDIQANWSIDWRRIGIRLSIPTIIFIVALILTRSRRRKESEDDSKRE